MKFPKLKMLLFGAVFSLMSTAQAAETLNISLNSSHYLRIPVPIVRVASGSPDIIGIVELKPSVNEILVVGKQAGATSLLIWTADGRMREYFVNVSPEDRGQASVIERAINLPHVHVKKVDDRVLLTGKVKNQYEREYAIKIAQLYVGSSGINSINNNQSVGASRNTNFGESLNTSVQTFSGGNSGGNIIDLLEIEFPTQVKFEAQIIEINESNAKDLGVQYYSSTEPDGTSADDIIGSNGTYYHGESWNTENNKGYRDFRNNPLKWFFAKRAPLNMTLNALVTSGKARILSRPNITTMSGEAASIHIGGQIPIPISDDGSISYEYKDYGVILKIVPNVDAQNKITSDVTAIVSSPDWTNAVSVSGTNVPGFLTREANAVINVESGMTMVIGGLITSDETKNISRIPLLSNIPILGELFKYRHRDKTKRELMILITPTLVTEETPAKMSDTMKDFYNEKQEENNNLQNVDLNALNEPFKNN